MSASDLLVAGSGSEVLGPVVVLSEYGRLKWGSGKRALIRTLVESMRVPWMGAVLLPRPLGSFE